MILGLWYDCNFTRRRALNLRFNTRKNSKNANPIPCVLPTQTNKCLLLIQVKAVYTDVLSAFPKEITQLEQQSVVFESLLLAASPYETVKQSTTVKLASSKVGVCVLK